MVMHPSPGHYSGTLVNALLHHCQLPALRLEAAPAPAPHLPAGDALAGAGSGAAGGEAATGEEDDGGALSDGDWDGDEELESMEGGGGGALPPGLGGLLSVPSQGAAAGAQAGSGSGSGPTIRPGIVHRLDKGTTGLVVVAKTDAALASLSTQVSGAGA